jgi:hypothetical protein
MKELLEEIKYDANFIKGHQLQPGWYKILKVLMILGFLIGYSILFGTARTLIFCGIFFSLSLLVHMIYRINTKRYTQSWLDFVVVEEGGENIPRKIGPYYYIAVVTNLAIAILISLLV